MTGQRSSGPHERVVGRRLAADPDLVLRHNRRGLLNERRFRCTSSGGIARPEVPIFRCRSQSLLREMLARDFAGLLDLIDD